MSKKFSFKIISLSTLIILTYLLSMLSLSIPKIKEHIKDLELKSIELKLSEIASLLDKDTFALKSLESSSKEFEQYKQSIIQSLKKRLKDLKIEKSGYIFVVSKDKKLLINQEANENLSIIHRQLVLRNANKSSIDYSYIKDSKIKSMIALASYNSYLEWYIIATIDKNELATISLDINRAIFMITLVIFILFFIFAVFIKRLLEPIKILSNSALEIQKGNLSVRNSIKQDDEVGVLAKHFNAMAQSLEKNIKDLENRVSQRTTELNNKFFFDDLTALKNKFAILDELQKDDTFSVIVIDIEAFDDINELYGYHVGNIVLQEYSRFLESFCEGKTYELFRIYGNTFALLDALDMVNMNFNKYEKDIHTLINSTKEYKIHIDKIDLHINIDVTLGVAIYQDRALSKASLALKYAKKNNKKFFVYNNLLDSSETTKNVIDWREKLKDAIDENKIVPFYQPIVNRDKKIIKYETLMRMRKIEENNQDTYISPFLFLDIAVRTKQYAKLSEKILKKALDDAKDGEYTISINLSFSDIEDNNIINLLDEYFTKENKDLCNRVVFEILEDNTITNYEIFDEFISKYRDLGVKFAIDDFGTGYSNFSRIISIRPEYIKIDGSLIKNIHKCHDSLELVKSIVKFSQELKIKTIAEFVHNEEVFNIVHELGVDEFQGYYFYEPAKEIKKES